jgi:hypothetical protein
VTAGREVHFIRERRLAGHSQCKRRLDSPSTAGPGPALKVIAPPSYTLWVCNTVLTALIAEPAGTGAGGGKQHLATKDMAHPSALTCVGQSLLRSSRQTAQIGLTPGARRAPPSLLRLLGRSSQFFSPQSNAGACRAG